MKNDAYKWRTAPPEAAEVSNHEFWYRRVWITMGGSDKVEPLMNMYQTVYTTEGGLQPYLSGCGETIAVNEIAEDGSVEWQPVMPPQGDTAAFESIEMIIETPEESAPVL